MFELFPLFCCQICSNSEKHQSILVFWLFIVTELMDVNHNQYLDWIIIWLGHCTKLAKEGELVCNWSFTYVLISTQTWQIWAWSILFALFSFKVTKRCIPDSTDVLMWPNSEKISKKPKVKLKKHFSRLTFIECL